MCKVRPEGGGVSKEGSGPGEKKRKAHGGQGKKTVPEAR